MNNNTIQNMITSLQLDKNLSSLTIENVRFINNLTSSLLSKVMNHTVDEITDMYNILWISNALYNNTDRSILPLEDGVYDLLLELYKKYNIDFQVGCVPIDFVQYRHPDLIEEVRDVKKLFKDISGITKDDMLFYDSISREPEVSAKDIQRQYLFKHIPDTTISKRLNVNKQAYPELVGTLDKCKFVLTTQAEEKGVVDDNNVKILERDFFAKHLEMGIISPDTEFSMVLELKYDGISVAGTVSSMIHDAFTRGDANEGIASDLTPILFNYKFPQATQFRYDNPFGMKFEAIMTHHNLTRYNILKGKNYSNCRTAISGLFASSDANLFSQFITLVPLATTLGVDRLTEIEFMNKYYNTGEYLRHVVITGTYLEILFQIKRFVEESEYMRDYMPFMYDGVVVSYIDEDIIARLGRSNSINKYSMAVKFNAMKKSTIVLGYSYTIGQNGSITPMIHYKPVEFFGTIHDKSSGHSYDRFKTLGLALGDIIDVEYVNDVMPYVSKPDNSYNSNNTNIPVEFITHCPSCNTELYISASGKTVSCLNLDCPERNLRRMVSMVQKLNMKDFSEATFSQLSKYSLTDLLNVESRDLLFMGDKTSRKFIERIEELKYKSISDYTIVGALGFNNIGRRKWKVILNQYTLYEVITMYNNNTLMDTLTHIKGIGSTTASVIIEEFNFFLNDLLTICSMSNIVTSKGDAPTLSVRFTGFRDKDVMEMLLDRGYDCSDTASVTKTTSILLIPYKGFTSSKLNKVGPQCKIVPIQDFLLNMEYYLNE